jgi:hypothetical protein
MKRDINFIKHIKPQLKEKERTDKAEGRQKRYEKVCRAFDIEPPALDIVDVGIMASLLRRFRQ